MNNDVAFIKKLKKEGYTQKQVCVIMNASKSTVSRIYNMQTYRQVSWRDYEEDLELENKKTVFDMIIECQEIAGMGGLSNQDKAYIKLLKHCHVDYKKVKDLYYDVPAKYIRPVWLYDAGVTYRDFDSTQIGIELEDYHKIIK